jgi:hypothetical protein
MPDKSKVSLQTHSGKTEKTKPLSPTGCKERVITYFLKEMLELILSLGTTFNVLGSAKMDGHGLALGCRNNPKCLLAKFLFHGLVTAKVDLGGDENKRGGRTVMTDLGNPLGVNIPE